MDKTLILTVGLPRCGKSTWAQSTGFPIVSPDAIRLALHGQRHLPSAEPMVWTIARYMVKSLFLAGHKTVILDATSVTAGQRRQWISSDWRTVVRIVPASPTLCKARATETHQDDLLPVIDRMHKELVDDSGELMEWPPCTDVLLHRLRYESSLNR